MNSEKLSLVKKSDKDNWYYSICNKENVVYIILCVICHNYVKEEYVALTLKDNQDFIFDMCEVKIIINSILT